MCLCAPGTPQTALQDEEEEEEDKEEEEEEEEEEELSGEAGREAQVPEPSVCGLGTPVSSP